MIEKNPYQRIQCTHINFEILSTFTNVTLEKYQTKVVMGNELLCGPL